MPPVRRSARLAGRSPSPNELMAERSNVSSTVGYVYPYVITIEESPPPQLERPDSPEIGILHTQITDGITLSNRPIPTLSRAIPLVEHVEQIATQSEDFTELADFVRQHINSLHVAEELRMLPYMSDYLDGRWPEQRTQQNRSTTATSYLLPNRTALPPELAVSKDIVDSFGPNGLIAGIEEEMTETEEKVFQNVLRRKMLCDVCMTHMKQFRCFKCLYALCSNCKNTITNQRIWSVTCPHCRKQQYEFEQIKQPRY